MHEQCDVFDGISRCWFSGSKLTLVWFDESNISDSNPPNTSA